MRRETREREKWHNNSPPTKRLRLRLGWDRVRIGQRLRLGYGSAITNNMDTEKIRNAGKIKIKKTREKGIKTLQIIKNNKFHDFMNKKIGEIIYQ